MDMFDSISGEIKSHVQRRFRVIISRSMAKLIHKIPRFHTEAIGPCYILSRMVTFSVKASLLGRRLDAGDVMGSHQ